MVAQNEVELVNHQNDCQQNEREECQDKIDSTEIRDEPIKQTKGKIQFRHFVKFDERKAINPLQERFGRKNFVEKIQTNSSEKRITQHAIEHCFNQKKNFNHQIQ